MGEAKPRRANLRLLAATNRNLEAVVQADRFREDLFYRLNVIALHLPPLREHRGDLMNIATGYLQFFSMQCGKGVKRFAEEAEQALRQYDWPGNLRELRNAVERAVILATGNHIEVADLPEKISQPFQRPETSQLQLGAKVTLEELETEHIRRVIGQTKTIEEAAQILGIDPATIYRKRKKLAL